MKISFINTDYNLTNPENIIIDFSITQTYNIKQILKKAKNKINRIYKNDFENQIKIITTTYLITKTNEKIEFYIKID